MAPGQENKGSSLQPTRQGGIVSVERKHLSEASGDLPLWETPIRGDVSPISWEEDEMKEKVWPRHRRRPFGRRRGGFLDWRTVACERGTGRMEKGKQQRAYLLTLFFNGGFFFLLFFDIKGYEKVQKIKKKVLIFRKKIADIILFSYF